MTIPTISIEVDPETARAYSEATPEEQRKLQLLLRLRLRELLTMPVRRLPQIMDEVGRVAEARGLTPEILESLLNEDDCFDDGLENDPRFLRCVAEAREGLRKGHGIRLDDVM